jgi:TPR repeat protein
LLIAAKAAPDAQASHAAASAAQIILATSGRPLALSPLLPRRQARYLLLQGLPAEAELSAGQRSASGAWMVKDEEVAALTLTIGGTASGDYPFDVYLLDSGDAPQARRSLVLRVAPAARSFLAGVDMGWAASLLDVAFSAQAAERQIAPAEAAAQLARAKQLLGEGDIAGARLLLRHLAERGQDEAPYELARTFDKERLGEIGAVGIEGDLARARDWYRQASQKGNVEAEQRLKILASLPGVHPSD